MSKKRHTVSMSYYRNKTFNHISLVYVSIYCESKTEKKKIYRLGKGHYRFLIPQLARSRAKKTKKNETEISIEKDSFKP